MSNSKPLVRNSGYVLKTTTGEQAESFLKPVLAIEEEIKANVSSLDLQKSPLKRCITLAKYAQTLNWRPRRNARNARSETSSHLSKAEIDALQVVNTALQNMSDENDLAVLRFCSARELRQAPGITQYSVKSVQIASKNQRQSDYSLALRGCTLGERYALNITNTEIQAWIRLLSATGAEHSVSGFNRCTNDWLTLDARICVLEQLQYFQ